MRIGFSTGWFHAKGIGDSMADIDEVSERVGANAVEIGLIRVEEERLSSLLSQQASKGYDFVSLHFPGDLTAYGNGGAGSDGLLSGLVELWNKYQPHSAVMHPSDTPEELYSLFRERGVGQIAIENMDRRKKSGFILEELDDLSRTHDLSFVLDLQHSYERAVDVGMDGAALSKEYLDMMITDGRLSHLHVSGEALHNGRESSHSLLYHAENRNVIMRALRYVLERVDVPIILEGEPVVDVRPGYVPSGNWEKVRLLAQFGDDLGKEIEYIKDNV
jgi:hypothetical protein